MNVVVLQVFVSLALVCSSILLFLHSMKQADHEHADRLALLPMESDEARSSPKTTQSAALNPRAKTGSDDFGPGPGAGSGSRSGSRSGSGSRIDSRPDSRTDSGTDSRTDSRTAPGSDSRTGSGTDSGPGSGKHFRTDVRTDSGNDSSSGARARPPRKSDPSA